MGIAAAEDRVKTTLGPRPQTPALMLRRRKLPFLCQAARTLAPAEDCRALATKLLWAHGVEDQPRALQSEAARADPALESAPIAPRDAPKASAGVAAWWRPGAPPPAPESRGTGRRIRMTHPGAALAPPASVTWAGRRHLITRRPGPRRRCRPAPPPQPRRFLLSKMAAPGALPPGPPPPPPSL